MLMSYLIHNFESRKGRYASLSLRDGPADINKFIHVHQMRLFVRKEKRKLLNSSVLLNGLKRCILLCKLLIVAFDSAGLPEEFPISVDKICSISLVRF